MKVAVTGGAGKFGRWLVAELTAGAAPHDVTVFDRRPPDGDDGKFRFVPGDVKALDQVVPREQRGSF